MVEQVAKKLSRVTHMDLSYCCNIRSRGSTAIGKNCKGLVTLQRNMHPQDVCPQDEDAAAIAANMSKFKHLQMIFNCKRTKSVKKIIESWPDLEELDMRACWDVALSPLAREVCSQEIPSCISKRSPCHMADWGILAISALRMRTKNGFLELAHPRGIATFVPAI
ncbi:F-box protein FBW2-like [Cynara cardunculus var. scolymus]|uniref:F-box protein FBW2-like n=1 Tax=Cynara cardunculus var. scolymus TaxID=59895 RepID=UPI000D6296CD|nr:F-box protein FBW2-like [Cynara cardunculus var. scolymus]